jgi:hypothetical protein
MLGCLCYCYQFPADIVGKGAQIFGGILKPLGFPMYHGRMLHCDDCWLLSNPFGWTNEEHRRIIR